MEKSLEPAGRGQAAALAPHEPSWTRGARLLEYGGNVVDGDRGAPEKQWASLNPAQLRMIERKARRVMKEFDYAPAKLDDEPSGLARWWAGIREIPAMIRCSVAWFRIYQEMKDPGFADTEQFVIGEASGTRGGVYGGGGLGVVASEVASRIIFPSELET